MVLQILAMLVLVHSVVGSNDYYWRDYEPNGINPIASDAFIGGKDVNQNNVYIGQANIGGNTGIHIGSVSPGKEVWVSYDGPKHATSFVQILCSEQLGRFKWVKVTSDNLHLVTVNSHTVHGGLDQNHIPYIGRVNHQGNVVIGKVYNNDMNNSDMVFIFNNQEYRVKSYEVLTYN